MAEEKKSSIKNYFSAELFGMALALFCVLALVCLITGDAVFSDLGLIVRQFLLGVFGYLSFPILILLCYFGVKAVIGFKVTNRPLKAIAVYLLLYTVFIVSIIHTAFTNLGALTFGEYIDACYRGGLSLSQSTPGGVLFGIITYPFNSLFTVIGNYIFCGFCLLAITLVLFRTPLKNAVEQIKLKNGDKQKTVREPKKQKKEKNNNSQMSDDGENLSVNTNNANNNTNENTNNSFSDSPFGAGFPLNNSSFKMRDEKNTKRGKDKDKEYSLNLLFGDNHKSFVSDKGGINTSQSYQKQYDDDLREKIEYIKSPYPIKGFKVDSPMGNKYDEGVLINSGRETDMHIDLSEPEKDIYVVNDGGRERERINSFDRASGRNYGDSNQEQNSGDRMQGGFDRFSSNDYNTDRFVMPDDNASPRDRSFANSNRFENVGRGETNNNHVFERGSGDFERDNRGAYPGERNINREDEIKSRESFADTFGDIFNGNRQGNNVRKDNDEEGGNGSYGSRENFNNRGNYNNLNGYASERFNEKQNEQENGRFGGREYVDGRNSERYGRSDDGYSTNATADNDEFTDEKAGKSDILRKLSKAERERDAANRARGMNSHQFDNDSYSSDNNSESNESSFNRGARSNMSSLNGSQRDNTPYNQGDNSRYNGDLHTEERTRGGFYEEKRDENIKSPIEQAQNGQNNFNANDEVTVEMIKNEQEAGGNANNVQNEQPKTGYQLTMNSISDDRKLENPIECIPKNYKFSFPPYNLLNDYKPDAEVIKKIKQEQQDRCDRILSILNNPNIDAKIVDVKIGPAISRFEIAIPPTVQMKRVTEKQDDINLWMEAKDKIRIIAPIPGTSRIGIEVPNSTLSTVGLKSILTCDEFKKVKSGTMCFGLGQDLVGKPIVYDITKMPHLIVAGATGTGKSVFLNTLLISLIYKYSPDDLRIILVDPKYVEFSIFQGMPELMFDEIFYDSKKTCAMLVWAVEEMERRYQLFHPIQARDIGEYNEYITASGGKKMFNILIIIDEFADLMAQQEDRKNMVNLIGRLASKARSAGIHLILATQRPSADIVDGSIKANFTSRISFKMSSQTDAMVIMGETGAEKLLGSGDMFFRLGKMSTSERAQGSFISGKEVNAVCNYVKAHNKCFYDEFALESINQKSEIPMATDPESSASGEVHTGNAKNDDEYIKEAMRIAITNGTISISMLQRKLSVGYPKAGKLVDSLVAKKYITEALDNKTRKILMTAQDFEKVFGEPI